MSLIVVLGMHRSGTSALTGVFNRLGFAAGKKLMPADAFNPSGYFEDELINARLELLLNQLERSWNDPRLLPNDWHDSVVAQAAEKDLQDLLHEEFDPLQPIVFKDPRACRLLPLLQDVWQSTDCVPRYVFALRSPHAVVRSLSQRDWISGQRAALLYLAYMLEAEQHTRGLPRAFVHYDALLSDWRSVIRHIWQELELEMPELNGNMTSCGDSIDRFLSSALNHHTEANDQSTGLAMNLAQEVYALLSGPMDDLSLAALDEVRGRWKMYLQDLEPLIVYSRNAQLIQAIGQEGRSELFYASTGQSFEEDRKLYSLWSFGDMTQQRFVFPELQGPIGSLRWDIIDRPAHCMVQKVWIEDDKRQVRWICPSGEDLFAQKSSDMHHLSSGASASFEVLSSGFDPHVTLNIPAALLHKIDRGWSFCTSMKVELPMLALAQLGQGCSALRQQLQSAKSDLTIAASERDSLRRSAATDSARMQELEAAVARLHTAFKRAEAQLDLYKGLRLADGLNAADPGA
ncbi:sulfotransferase family protein [Limnohabitans planktonicus]|nr:hypothetical protein [Limnohabitans planktonicus]